MPNASSSTTSNLATSLVGVPAPQPPIITKRLAEQLWGDRHGFPMHFLCQIGQVMGSTRPQLHLISLAGVCWPHVFTVHSEYQCGRQCIRSSTLRLPSTPRNLPVLRFSQRSADLLSSYFLSHFGFVHDNSTHMQTVCPHAFSVMLLNARLLLPGMFQASRRGKSPKEGLSHKTWIT